MSVEKRLIKQVLSEVLKRLSNAEKRSVNHHVTASGCIGVIRWGNLRYRRTVIGVEFWFADDGHVFCVDWGKWVRGVTYNTPLRGKTYTHDTTDPGFSPVDTVMREIRKTICSPSSP